MSDAAPRRPLLLLLAAYVGALSWLHARGYFAPACAVSGRPEVRWLARATDAPKEDLRGWKSDVAAGGVGAQVRWPSGAALEDLPLPGDLVSIDGRLRAPRRPRNFGDFDEAEFLADRGIAAVLEAAAFRRLPGRPPARFWAGRLGERLRRSVHARLFARLAPDQARLGEGLLLGYKGALPRPLQGALRDAGLIHLLVPSGAKTALALLAAALLAARLRLPPLGGWLLAAALGGAVTLAAGAEPPYARAYLAGLALLGARALGREGDAFQALVASAWLLLLWEPRALFSEGFQMTYAALVGILAWWPAARGLGRARAALVMGAAVQAALWPMFACDFGRASLVGAATNLLAVPAYPALAGLGWAAWAASFAGARAGAWAALPLSWALAGLRAFCENAARVPHAATALSPWAWTTVCGYYAAFLALPRLRRPDRRPAGAAALALGAGLFLGGYAYRRWSAAPIRVVVLAVPPAHGRRRHAALITYHGTETETILEGEAPPGLLAKVERALDLSPDRASRHLFPIRLGNAKISPLTSAQEVLTDGVEVHVGIPR